LSWLTPLPWYVEVVASATDPRGEGTGRSFLPEGTKLESAGDFEYLLAIKQFFDLNDDWSLAVGLSGATAPSTPDERAVIAADDLDPAWTDRRQRVSANLTFWPTEFSRLRAQASADLPGWQDDPIYAFMLAAEFVVGAHGAHKF